MSLFNTVFQIVSNGIYNTTHALLLWKGFHKETIFPHLAETTNGMNYGKTVRRHQNKKQWLHPGIKPVICKSTQIISISRLRKCSSYSGPAAHTSKSLHRCWKTWTLSSNVYLALRHLRHQEDFVIYKIISRHKQQRRNWQHNKH